MRLDGVHADWLFGLRGVHGLAREHQASPADARFVLVLLFEEVRGADGVVRAPEDWLVGDVECLAEARTLSGEGGAILEIADPAYALFGGWQRDLHYQPVALLIARGSGLVFVQEGGANRAGSSPIGGQAPRPAGSRSSSLCR